MKDTWHNRGACQGLPSVLAESYTGCETGAKVCFCKAVNFGEAPKASTFQPPRVGIAACRCCLKGRDYKAITRRGK